MDRVSFGSPLLLISMLVMLLAGGGVEVWAQVAVTDCGQEYAGAGYLTADPIARRPMARPWSSRAREASICRASASRQQQRRHLPGVVLHHGPGIDQRPRRVWRQRRWRVDGQCRRRRQPGDGIVGITRSRPAASVPAKYFAGARSITSYRAACLAMTCSLHARRPASCCAIPR